LIPQNGSGISKETGRGNRHKELEDTVSKTPIRVLVVDDSAFTQEQCISDMLNEDPGIQLWDVAREAGKIGVGKAE